MSKITSIKSYMVLDSRGLPTVAVELGLDHTYVGLAYVPSGASTGQYEALELRDGNKAFYGGKGVTKAIQIISGKLCELLKGKFFDSQSSFDECLKEIDGTNGYQKLGANSVLALSLAFSRALAKCKDKLLYESINDSNLISIPIPMLNVINGGAHANNNLDIQEFMIVPHGFEFFSDAMRAGCEVYQNLRNYLANNQYATSVGDEGGFAPNMNSANQVLEILSEIIEKSGYKLGQEISFALDVAASEFYQSNQYIYEKNTLSSNELIKKWISITNEYPILSIEDPLADDDIAGWQTITKELGSQTLIVGDDLLVTSFDRLQKGIDEKWMNSILIKLNQVGTLTETLKAINLAKSHQKSFIISHRSGETEDTFISDLAIATNAPFIKTGAPCRSERLAKYNRLLTIENNVSAKLFKFKSMHYSHG